MEIEKKGKVKKLLRRLTGAVMAIAFVALVFGLMTNQALADPGGGQIVINKIQNYNITITTTSTEPAAVIALDTSPNNIITGVNDAIISSANNNGSANVWWPSSKRLIK